jgi:hypothetical protein
MGRAGARPSLPLEQGEEQTGPRPYSVMSSMVQMFGMLLAVHSR